MPCPASLCAPTNHLHALQPMVHHCRIFYVHGHILHMHLLYMGIYAGIQEQYHPQLKLLHAIVCHILHFKHSCICLFLSSIHDSLLPHPKSQYCSYLKGKRKGEPCSPVPAQYTNPDVVSLCSR